MRWEFTLAMVRNDCELQCGTRFRSRERALAALARHPNHREDGYSEEWLLIFGPPTVAILADGKISIGPSVIRNGSMGAMVTR